MIETAKICREFRRVFPDAGRDPIFVARAPGRVNLIGEHTDYNDGYVLPMAVDRTLAIAFQPVSQPRAELISLDFNQRASFSFDDMCPCEEMPWLNYPQGVAWALKEAGHSPGGLRGVVAGDVPLGAGLSSSAAFEVAAATAFCRAGGIELPGVETATLCQRAENEFVGMRCGIMDQYVSVFAAEGHALLIDCKTLEHRQVPLPNRDTTILVCDTGVKHELVATEYNTRRAECEEALRRLVEAEPDVRSFRDVTAEHVAKHATLLEGPLLKRARHVVSESQRVLDAVAALEADDAPTFGRLIDASHESLRDDFAVSCAELDTLVDLARHQAGTLGARMVGGGFGGCTVNLVRTEAVEAVRAAVTEGYQAATGREAATYVFRPAAGAAVEKCDA